ncbi:MAG: TIGR00730 family Rossman fold protein [Muribaculaceae bacterium]|nr:TIGR00730 family Rossman fold protein [Muribaculaceae bacterium]
MQKAITVYCGSASDCRADFLEAAAGLGREIAARGVRLVTGAGHTGLMGAVVDACMATGGQATGIIPQFMVDRGWHHRSMTELIVVPDMHRRKELMAARATGVIALPGGIGTFEELLEIITWRQLGLFSGNVVIYNVDGYYSPLLAMIEAAVAAGFMRPDHRRLFTVVTTAAQAVDAALAENPETEFSAKF